MNYHQGSEPLVNQPICNPGESGHINCTLIECKKHYFYESSDCESSDDEMPALTEHVLTSDSEESSDE